MSATRPNDEAQKLAVDHDVGVDEYIPTADELLDAAGLSVRDLQDEEVTVSSAFVRFLLAQFLLRTEFCEASYLRVNPDVDAGVEEGRVGSAREHFAFTGYLENRPTGDIRVDEQWYLSAYPDVTKAYMTGRLTDLQKHFNATGRFEGRVGSAKQWEQRKRWDALLEQLV